MPISRVTGGFALMGASIFLFLIAGLMDDPEVSINIEWSVSIEILFFIAALVLMGLGLHFVFFGKYCPVCNEKVGRAATECRHCRYNFDAALGPISRSPKIKAK
jgi:hypothetical protein